MKEQKKEQGALPSDFCKIPLTEIKRDQAIDSLAGATQGFLGQRVLPDAVSGPSAI